MALPGSSGRAALVTPPPAVAQAAELAERSGFRKVYPSGRKRVKGHTGPLASLMGPYFISSNIQDRRPVRVLPSRPLGRKSERIPRRESQCLLPAPRGTARYSGG